MPKVKDKHISTRCPFARLPRCPICLQKVKRSSFPGSCSHEFCFVCLTEWSEMSDKCPVCRTKYTKIIYDKKSETQFRTRAVVQRVNEDLRVEMVAFCRLVRQLLSQFRSIHETNIRQFNKVLTEALAENNMEALKAQLDHSVEEFTRISFEMQAEVPQNNNPPSLSRPVNHENLDETVFLTDQSLMESRSTTGDAAAASTAGNNDRPGPISEIGSQLRELHALFQSNINEIQAILESKLNEENVNVFMNVVQSPLQKFLNLYGNIECLDKELGDPMSKKNMETIACFLQDSVVVLDTSAFNDSNSEGHINLYPNNFKEPLKIILEVERVFEQQY